MINWKWDETKIFQALKPNSFEQNAKLLKEAFLYYQTKKDTPMLLKITKIWKTIKDWHQRKQNEARTDSDLHISKPDSREASSDLVTKAKEIFEKHGLEEPHVVFSERKGFVVDGARIPEEDDEVFGQAWIDPETKKEWIHINPKALESESNKSKDGLNLKVGNDLESVLLHEYGHIEAKRKGEDFEYSLDKLTDETFGDRSLSNQMKLPIWFIVSEVSLKAGEDWNEFYAEVFAGKKLGKKYSEYIENIWNALDKWDSKNDVDHFLEILYDDKVMPADIVKSGNQLKIDTALKHEKEKFKKKLEKAKQKN